MMHVGPSEPNGDRFIDFEPDTLDENFDEFTTLHN